MDDEKNLKTVVDECDNDKIDTFARVLVTMFNEQGDKASDSGRHFLDVIGEPKGELNNEDRQFVSGYINNNLPLKHAYDSFEDASSINQYFGSQ